MAAMAALSSSNAPLLSTAVQKHSCVLCQQRKVKCDRKDPCSNCTKSRVDCIFRAPAIPRRRQKTKKPPDADLLLRLKRYEDLLKNYGAKIPFFEGQFEGSKSPTDLASSAPVLAPIGQPQHSSPGVDQDVESILSEQTAVEGLNKLRQSNRFEEIKESPRGKLISKEGKSRYLENNLWASITDELRDSTELLHVSSEDDSVDTQGPRRSPEEEILDGGEFILKASQPGMGRNEWRSWDAGPLHDQQSMAGPQSGVSLAGYHPPPGHIFRLWQIFLDNINPLTKVVHTPTMQQTILEASSNASGISRTTEPLIFAIYACAVYSMESGDCEAFFGECKTRLLNRYRSATQHALMKAGFLKSGDLKVLQAFTLFLLTMRQYYDAHTLWSLTGVAARIGQRIGLHRDGEPLGLPPFETEMRRRLWWQIVPLDAIAGEISGSGTSIMANTWDTKLPLNVNDSDLYPGMKEPPVEHVGPTEMLCCQLRSSFGHFFLRKMHLHPCNEMSFDGPWQKLSDRSVPVAEKETDIAQLKEYMDQTILKHSDPTIPLHWFASVMAESAICAIRLRAHLPRYFHGSSITLFGEERDSMFNDSVRCLELVNITHGNKSLRGFMWHVKCHFQWYPFIFLLNELRRRPTDDCCVKAWRMVTEIYQNRPEFVQSRSMLHVAVRNLVAKAWEARMTTAHVQGAQEEVKPPSFIPAHARQPMAAINAGLNLESKGSQSNGQMKMELKESQLPTNAFDGSFPVGPQDSPMDWEAWDSLLQEFQGGDEFGQMFATGSLA